MRNLSRLPLVLKSLFTGYLLVAGVGLLMAGAQIFLTHGLADGELGLSVDDVVYSYYGDRGSSRLESKLDGTMKDKASTQDRARIVKWVRDGASAEAWKQDVGAVFATNCTKCHGAIPGLPSFTSYESVRPFASPADGATIQDLTRLSHIHLFGIAFINVFLCAIFSLSHGFSRRWKAALVVFPFLFLLIDIASWWWTKWWPGAAWLTIVGGALNNGAAGVMITCSLWQLWVTPQLRADPPSEDPWA